MNQFSFKKGWSQVKQGDIKTARAALMSALGINTRNAFLDRMKGKIEPRVTEAKMIERVFAEFGITEIWGE